MSDGASNRSFNSDIPLEQWETVFAGEASVEDVREILPHACDWCGRIMKYADQQCGCTAKR